MVDTVYVANAQCLENPVLHSVNWVDTLLAFAMAVIAVTDVVVTYLLFKQSRKDSSESAYKTRKFELMQTLMLNSNINKFYKFFDDVSEQCIKLRTNTDKATKAFVNQSILTSLKIFRLDFITLVKVIDTDLYNDMIKNADLLIDGITEAIFDPGINLNHEPKYDEVVTQQISKCRTDCLTMLLSIATEEVQAKTSCKI